MPVEFDPAKRQATLDHRGLEMAHAEEVFAGTTITIEDDRQDYGEVRFITVGRLDGRMVVMVWTPRGAVRRIISLRKANDREQALYAPRLDRS
ncbi:MAG: BrnT family toxin [Methylacidiphilales bacterium]|nr:BrnT family toxin [Candidatus Methylacidiphilales bacterium]